MAKNEKHHWYKRPIITQDHIPDLERDAALNEFEQGLPREDAEENAYQAYRRKHHIEGAAHHLRGLKAAQEAGDLDECKKHGVAYSMHLGHLGHDPMDAVPDEVKKLVDGETKPKVYKFKSHKSDHFLVG
jgi:hypothetical protein